MQCEYRIFENDQELLPCTATHDEVKRRQVTSMVAWLCDQHWQDIEAADADRRR